MNMPINPVFDICVEREEEVAPSEITGGMTYGDVCEDELTAPTGNAPSSTYKSRQFFSVSGEIA